MGIGFLDEIQRAQFDLRRIQGLRDYAAQLEGMRSAAAEPLAAATEPLAADGPDTSDLSVPAGKVGGTNERERQASADATVARGPLTGRQRSVVMGAAVPLVFCNRRNLQEDGGGVFLSPPATDVAITTDADGNVVSQYVLVIGQGQFNAIQETDLFHGVDQAGTLIEQAYDQRPVLASVPANTEEPIPETNYATWYADEGVTSTSGDPLDPLHSYSFSITSRLSYVTRLTVSVAFYYGSGVGEVVWKRESAVLTYAEGENTGTVTHEFSGAFLASSGNPRVTAPSAYRVFVSEIAKETLTRDGYGGPLYVGSGSGTFANLTSIVVENTKPAAAEAWDLQHHVFIRQGVNVPRIRQGDTGPSENFVDLCKFLWETVEGIPADLIDSSSLAFAAEFTHRAELWFNGALSIPEDVPGFIASTAPFFLLRPSLRGGKLGLQPMITADTVDGVNTDPVTAAADWGPAEIIPGSVSAQYRSREEREPFRAVVSWRLQPEGQAGETVTSEIGCADAPKERLFDMSDFCSTHRHAASFGAMVISQAINITHTLTLQRTPGDWQLTYAQGDIIRVTLPRRSSTGDDGVFSNFYRLVSMRTAAADAVDVTLQHLPVTSEGVSVVALDVASMNKPWEH